MLNSLGALVLLALFASPAAGVDWKQVLKPGSVPVEQVLSGNGVFFTVRRENRAGLELWHKVRTPPGAVKLLDLPAGSRDLTAAGGFLYFVTGEDKQPVRLHVSDTTPAGTKMIKQFPPWTRLAELTGKDKTLFFTNDVPGGKKRFELWKSDGTGEGTARIRDINPELQVVKARILSNDAESLSFFTLFYRVICHGGATYAPRIRRMQIWQSDGTPDGTRVIHDFKTKPPISEQFRILGQTPGSLCWVYDTRWEGAQLFMSDGTRQGTVLVKKLGQARPFEGVLTGKTLFFYVRHESDIEIWRSDGSDDGTRMLERIVTSKPLRYKKIVSSMSAPCGKLFMIAQTQAVGAWQLWTSDGTAEGTGMLLDVDSPMLDIGGHKRNISVLGCFDSRVFVRVDSERRQSGQATARRISELYATDGSVAGTSLIWHQTGQGLPE